MRANALAQRYAQPGFAKLRAFPQRPALGSQGAPVIGLQVRAVATRQHPAVRRRNGSGYGSRRAECPVARQTSYAQGAFRGRLWQSGAVSA